MIVEPYTFLNYYHKRKLQQNTSPSPSISLFDSPSLLAVDPLDDDVPDHTNRENACQNVELDAGADEVAVRKGDGEAERLPHSVVGEGRFRFGAEQTPVEGFEYEKRTDINIITRNQ